MPRDRAGADEIEDVLWCRECVEGGIGPGPWSGGYCRGG